MKLKEQVDHDRMLDEMKEVSFYPHIFTNPKRWQQRDPDAKPEDYLWYKMMVRNQNIEKLKKQKEDNIMEEC